jgi:hypothetical protein
LPNNPASPAKGECRPLGLPSSLIAWGVAEYHIFGVPDIGSGRADRSNCELIDFLTLLTPSGVGDDAALI